MTASGPDAHADADTHDQGAHEQDARAQVPYAQAPSEQVPYEHVPSEPAPPPDGARTYGPRERMVLGAARLICRNGVGATGMREVAAHANAPRGSLQHYFPGGKEQLVNEAVAWAGRYAGRRVARCLASLPEPSPSGLFAAMVGQWTREYETAGFASGCPVAAATVDCAESVESTRTAVAAAFATWNEPVVEALTGMGVPADRAPALATLMVSALEGAILIARSEQDVRALTTVARELGPLLDSCVVHPS